MTTKNFWMYVVLVVCAASGCSSPVTPAGSVTVTTGSPVSPANGAAIANGAQPVTLSIVNALVTDSAAAVTYEFEVAIDSAFTGVVQVKEVPQASNSTSVRLDTLAAGKDYYWRVRTVAGGTRGAYTAPTKFTIGPAVTLQTPGISSPVNGDQNVRLRPWLIVTNAARSGPSGKVKYRFEVSTASTFASIVAGGVVDEDSRGTTGFKINDDLSMTTTYFWRVQVIDDASGVTSAYATASFRTAFTIDLKKVIYLKGPDISNWKETADLQLVEQDGAGDGPVCMKYTDPGWPDVLWPYGGDDPNFGVYANQWYFANIGGTWYGGAGEWIYRTAASSCKAGQGTFTIGPDSGFGPPFSSWVPKVGELVGYAVTAVARNYPAMRSVDERSNVIVQPWRDTGLGSK